MNRKQRLLAFIFIDFALLSGWALYHVGYMGVLEVAIQHPGSTQVFVDLAIALGIGFAFIWPDAKRRGINPLPYLVVALFLGSFGPLAYLIRREWSRQGAAEPARPAA